MDKCSFNEVVFCKHRGSYMIECKNISGYEDIYKLLNEYSNIFPNLSQRVIYNEFAQKLEAFADVYVLCVDGKNAGMIAFYSNDEIGKTAYITLIGVKKNFRNLGLGKQLLKFCESVSIEKGFTKIKLEVNKLNETAIRFYIRNGFSQISQDEKSLYMMKELENK